MNKVNDFRSYVQYNRFNNIVGVLLVFYSKYLIEDCYPLLLHANVASLFYCYCR